jgi:K+-sensing histidine kinase KdpD
MNLDLQRARSGQAGADGAPPDARAGYGWATLYCIGATLAALPLRSMLAEANVVLIYLLAVVLATVQFGRGPGVLASLLAVLGFDIFMVRPYHSLLVADPQYLLTFSIMLAVSLIVSHLTANLRRQALIAHYRERRAIALFKLSQDLSGALTGEQVAVVAMQHLDTAFQARVLLLVADRSGKLDSSPVAALAGGAGLAACMAALAVYQRARSAEASDRITVVGRLQFLPLRAPMCTRGLLVVQMPDGAGHTSEEQARLLRTFAAQIALAIERVHYADVARESEIAMASERLRNSLLSAVSHDIRTPLSAIVGLSSTLAGSPALVQSPLRELALAIQGDALRMDSLVTNLLDMARLHGGAVRLNSQWQMLEEVVGSALASLGAALDGIEVDIALPSGLPLLRFDAVLIERVLCNLLDNALKYAPACRWVRICAEQGVDEVSVSVEDGGPGVPDGMEGAIFAKFVRGHAESNKPGVGLGLAICRAIVAAHRGTIAVANRAGGGARFVFTLPLGVPPAHTALEEHEEPDAHPMQQAMA